MAVVDLGSNSVRLVVYEGLRRSSSPLYNEKVLCGLGSGVALSGTLSDAAVTRVLAALRRFRALCRLIGAKQIFAVATAAVREAKNGPQFIRRARAALGASIDVLSGRQEAQFAAMGVLSGIPEADGVVGDLGGGSLELVDVRDGKMRGGVTLPIGPLRLIDLSGGSMKAAKRIVEEALLATKLVNRLRGRDFYAVGGTWRNLGRLHMAQQEYPLHVLHNYRIPREAARSVADLVAGLSPASLRDVRVLSRSRSDTLPFGAMVLERILDLSKPRNVVISVFGVREGILYSKLDKRIQRKDVLLSACWDFTRRYARSPRHELELCDWTDQLVKSRSIKESGEQRQLRHAACLLADIGWRAHPEYRGSRSLTTISQAAFVGVDHPGRVFLALTVFFRYEGPTSEAAPREFVRLIDERQLERAQYLSAAMRLAYVLSAAMPGLLPSIRLRQRPGRELLLELPGRHAALWGERVEKRLSELALIMGLNPRIKAG
ncbi:MAG: Ppx/GppA family phosphatase [Pseudomonadota bacterium]|nr:Ppx/GppA family phosphatase [Pseudomonadota bacterium]